MKKIGKAILLFFFRESIEYLENDVLEQRLHLRIENVGLVIAVVMAIWLLITL